MDRYENENDELEPADGEETSETNETIEELRRQLKAQEEIAQSYLANWQRTQADLENIRKRAQQERAEAINLANSALLRKILGAIDDLERAFSHPTSEMCDPAWVEGARMSFQSLKSALESEGLEPIASVGKEFDPRYHEAVLRRSGEEVVVLEEMQKGYTLNGRVLRPSRVIVGTSEETDAEDQE